MSKLITRESPQSIFIQIDNEPFTVSKDDIRFKLVKKYIKLNDEKKIKEILKYKSIPTDLLTFKNGTYYFKEKKFTIEFSKLLIKNRLNLDNFNNFLNYYITNHGYKDVEHNLTYAMNHGGYFLSDSGYHLVYNGRRTLDGPFLNTRAYVSNLFNTKTTISEISKILKISEGTLHNLIINKNLSDSTIFLLKFYGNFRECNNNNIQEILKINMNELSSKQLLNSIYNNNENIVKFAKSLNLSNTQILNKFNTVESFYYSNQCSVTIMKIKEFMKDYSLGKFSSFKVWNTQLIKIYHKFLGKETEMDLGFINPKFSRSKIFHIDKTFRLTIPESRLTLVQWTEELKHCIHLYYKQASTGESILFGLYKNNKLFANIEIRNNKIVQFKGYRNSIPKLKDRDKNKIIKKALKLAYYKEIPMNLTNGIKGNSYKVISPPPWLLHRGVIEGDSIKIIEVTNGLIIIEYSECTHLAIRQAMGKSILISKC